MYMPCNYFILNNCIYLDCEQLVLRLFKVYLEYYSRVMAKLISIDYLTIISHFFIQVYINNNLIWNSWAHVCTFI